MAESDVDAGMREGMRELARQGDPIVTKRISFENRPALDRNRKTKTWAVWSVDSSVELGEVRWYPPWRRYAFYPSNCTFFEMQCLRDIAAFLEQQTSDHLARRRRKGIG